MAQKNVIIIGGGYAGIVAANRLVRKSSDIRITLVTANHTFAEKIRNHQIIAGTKQKTHEIAKMVHKSVNIVFSKVKKIQPDQSFLLTEEGECLAYDFLGFTPGMKESEFGMKIGRYYSVANEAECIKLRKILLENPNSKITVLGAGLSGIETAAELAENYPGSRITLLDSGTIGRTFHESAVVYMKKVLSNLNVNVLEKTRAETFQEDCIITSRGEKIFHTACVISSGLVASDLGSKSGLAHNHIGQVYVDQYMQVPEYPNIIGAGDAVQIPGEKYSYLRMACATALPMGIYMAERMANLLSLKTAIGNKPFSFGYFARCVSLGRKEGLLQFVSPYDLPQDKILTGRLGAFMKELVCKFTILSFRAEKYFDFYKWPTPKEPIQMQRRVLAATTK